MTSIRDLMTSPVQCIDESQTLAQAARMMADLDVGALPICGADGKLHGMLTDRDIVIKALARGKDPGSTTAGQLANGKPFYVDVDASIDEALQIMSEHQVRRLPVISDHKLVGMVSQCDVARNESKSRTGELVGAISQP